MSAGTRYRGQPLLVLVALLGGWVALRILLWEAPFAAQPARAFAASDVTQPAVASAADPTVEPEAMPIRTENPFAGQGPVMPAWSVEPVPAPLVAPEVPELASEPPMDRSSAPASMKPRVAAGHNVLLLAAFAQMELPEAVARLAESARAQAAAFQPARGPVSNSVDNRWSADAWLLLRKDTTTAVTSGRGSYGQSQLGAVLRYRLVQSSPHKPSAYLRASQALAGARESEAALGLSARPIPSIPIVTAGELRLTLAAGRTSARAATYAVTELPPFDLPQGFRGEAYAQAGYVWGDFATGFVDGQARIEREVARLGVAELRAGGGAWGGAQKGAARLDIGPSASLAFKLGETPSRLSMDWRFRVAGDAEPTSGPTLTISAGF